MTSVLAMSTHTNRPAYDLYLASDGRADIEARRNLWRLAASSTTNQARALDNLCKLLAGFVDDADAVAASADLIYTAAGQAAWIDTEVPEPAFRETA